jgi:hypothetical protein
MHAFFTAQPAKDGQKDGSNPFLTMLAARLNKSILIEPGVSSH